jgi:hypothetical protein
LPSDDLASPAGKSADFISLHSSANREIRLRFTKFIQFSKTFDFTAFAASKQDHFRAARTRNLMATQDLA